MTDTIDLEAIEARVNAATEGPWYAHGSERMVESGDTAEEWHGYAWVGFNRKDGDGPQWDATLVDLDRSKDGHEGFRDHALPDADFIAHARSDIPALIAEVCKLQIDIVQVNDFCGAEVAERERLDIEIAALTAERDALQHKLEDAADTIRILHREKREESERQEAHIIDLINRLNTALQGQVAQGWRKFPDELPPRHQHVWCLNRDGYQFEGCICYGLHAPFFTYPRGDGNASNTAPAWIDVTHWRPLPSPPAVNELQEKE